MTPRDAAYGWIVASAALCALVVGCPADDDDDSSEGQDPDTVVLTDSNNYSIDAELDIQHYELAEHGDPLFSWGHLTQDLQGHPLDPTTDIDVFAAAVFRYLSEDEVVEGLSTNSLAQDELAIYVLFETGGATSAHLSEMRMFGGTDIDVEQYFEPSYGTWLFTLNTGTSPAQGTRMAAFFEPTQGVATTEVAFADDSASVEVDADLTSLTPVQAPADTPFVLDWGALATHGSGDVLRPDEIDQLMIARYDGATPADLADQILDLELIAAQMWIYELSSGTELDLAVTPASGGSFEGVTSEGTWILALRCSTCANPTPPFLTVLE